jgi:hypothetical protein
MVEPMSITSMHGCQNMIKESRSRPGSDWPRSTENFRSPVTEKGETVSRQALVELGGHVGAIK